MEANPIVYIDHSEVRGGKLDELKDAIRELARFVEDHVPRIVGYHAYFSADGSNMTVLHIHRDAESLDEHMRISGPMFPKFADFIRLTRIEIYGTPSRQALEGIRAKAERLGGASVEMQLHHAGFLRQP